MTPDLTVAEILARLAYDPVTGLFTRRVAAGPHAHPAFRASDWAAVDAFFARRCRSAAALRAREGIAGLRHHDPMTSIVRSINVSRARAVEINGQSVMTGIFKRAVDQPVSVKVMGIEGDEQSDLSVHGGLTKAVYAYPVEHYGFWQTVRAQAKVAGWDEPLVPGALGENLTISGFVESEAFIGDVLRFADCELAVSEPRFPCFKFNAAMGFNQAAKLMGQNAWCGFYLAVRIPGTLRPGESFELLPGPREVGIQELFRSKMSRAKLG
jgi:MOSC domain-containing protein YiiM